MDRAQFLTKCAAPAVTAAIYRMLGIALLELDEPRRAHDAQAAALALVPTDVDVLRALARACRVLDLDSEAEAHLRDALALTTDRSTRLAVLDDYLPVLVSLGDWTEVLRRADEALRPAPDDTVWLAMRLRALTELHLDAEKLSVVRRITSLPGADAELHLDHAR